MPRRAEGQQSWLDMNKLTGPSLVSTLAATLPKAKVKTVAKTLQDLKAEPLLGRKAVKTEADTLPVVQAYGHINTRNKVVAEAIRKLSCS